MSRKYKIGITLGDINGIGPEVILKTLSNQNLLDSFTPIIYGSGKVLGYHKNIIKNSALSFVSVSNAKHATEGKINVINAYHETVNINLGKPTEESGQFAYTCLDTAVNDLYEGFIDGLVTGPINKQAMQMANFPEKGHTEYIAKKVGDEEPLMFMVSDEIKVAVATTHIPVIGLNPHAGEEGTIGTEEQEFIQPIIIELKKKGYMVTGPHSADGFFGSGEYAKYDGILAMYHDQGLIPFKSLCFGKGVNYTAGLKVIRTSPDHGTGYDIAGENKADPASFREALYTCMDIITNRRSYNSARANKLIKEEAK